MVTAPVYQNSYTTYYTDSLKYDCLQAAITLRGEEGKQIRIDKLTLSLASSSSNAVAEAWINAVADGKLIELTRWKESKTSLQPKIAYPVFMAPAGKDVTLFWHLKTSIGSSKAIMKYITYKWSLVDVEPIVEPEIPDTENEPEPPDEGGTVEDVPCRIEIKCLESEVDGLIEKIKAVVTENEVTIFVKK